MGNSADSPFAASVTLTLIHFLWQGTLVALVYWLVTTAMDFRSARTRYAVALSALAMMAVCPIVTFSVVHDSLAMTAASSLSDDTPLTRGNSIFDADRQIEDVSSQSAVQQNPVDMQARDAYSAQSFSSSAGVPWLQILQPWVLPIWLAGVVLSGARLVSGLFGVFWLKSGRGTIPAELHEYSQRVAERLNLKTARVFASTRVRVAAAVGFLKPVVLLPALWVTELPPEVLQAVIAHELAHIRRFDTWINLLQRIVETLFFYHPLVWWLSNRLRYERELCCDELAVMATGDRTNYVIALEQVGRLEAHGGLSLMTAITGDRKMNLLSRIQNVLGLPQQHREQSWLVGAAALICSVSMIVALGLFPATPQATAQEREGGQSAEEKADGRRSPESEAGARRSAEAEAGARRPAEGEGRQSPEGEARGRRSPEGERESPRGREPGRDSDREGGRERDGGADALRGFRPQTDREAALLQMIEQLRREVAALRREVQVRGRGDADRDARRDGDRAPRDGDFRRDGDARRDSDTRREGDSRRDGDMRRDADVFVTADQFRLEDNWQRSKEGGIFRTYDKNGDQVVSLEEWLAMTNGDISPARREISTKHFNDAEPSGDGKFTPAEFIWWRRIGSRQAAQRMNQNRARDGEGSRRGPRDGERERTGPRDGERETDRERSPRDGDSERRGPRDGDREERAPRDGDRDAPRKREGERE